MIRRFLQTVLPFCLTLVASCMPMLQAGADAEGPIDFQRQIRPILAEHCLQCHGPDEATRQAGLRLDSRESAISERESGRFAIVPGSAESSQLWLRVTARDSDSVMPPPDHSNKLHPDQQDLFRQWIDEGAAYTVHWAFAAPQWPIVPPVPVATGSNHTDLYVIRNEVDSFVADRLAGEGLAMSPTAPAGLLCRRLHLDLIGLPPSPGDVEAFDKSIEEKGQIGAVDVLVEHLLASDHFGEKWARHWLDVARFADTNGYEKDERRDQWAWRDWVIRALNVDMPYDQFIIEQVAGDLLPNRTQDQIIATGFLRNGMVNEEGAIVPEQFRMEGLFDRMDCIGKAVLGLSIQCAQCHSHKFDPISQDEYYGMFAFVNDTCEAQSPVYAPAQLQQIAKIDGQIAGLERQCREVWRERTTSAATGLWEQQIAAWEQTQREIASRWTVLNTHEEVWVGGVNHPHKLADHSVMVLGHATHSGEMYVVADPDLHEVTGLRLEALTHGDLPFGGPGRNSFRGTFAVSELRVEVKPPGRDWIKLALQDATADFSQPEQTHESDGQKNDDEKRRVGPVAFLIDGDELTAWRPDRGPSLRHTDSVAVVQFTESQSFPTGTQLKVSLVFKHSAPGNGRHNTMLGRIRFGLTKSPGLRATTYDHAATLAMQKPSAKRTELEQATVVAAWRSGRPELKQLCDQISALRGQYPEPLTSVLTLAAREPNDGKTTYLLDRGIWDRAKHPVEPHVPAVLHPLNTLKDSTEGTQLTRLDFARWLVDRRSPLTARVHVNRVWQAIFGAGLVATPEDFGTRAQPPVHIQLLDWLSVDFMEQGWSTKHLIHTIVSSATYQQASRTTAELREFDPLNQWFARGPRFRVEAEVLRDIVLTVSGLLHRGVGGPSIFPPIPESVLQDNFKRPAYWDAAEDAQRYRRSIYLFRKRSMPDPLLASFDAPNADAACARRVRSNTPLASLVALNETVFVEAARAAALRVLREGGATDSERADYAFRLCTGRRIKPKEMRVVLALLKTQRSRLSHGWLSINEIATGDPTQHAEMPAKTTPQDAAAWTIVARVLLNLDATLCKG